MSRFFYTFGTIFLIAVVIVCAVNFKRDARAFQKTPAVSADMQNKASDGKDGKGGQEAQGDKAASGFKSSSDSQTATGTKPSSNTAAQPGNGKGTKTGSGSAAKKPSNPGEEP